MLQEYNRYKILQVFFDFPRKDFHIREIVRITKIGQPSVINHLKKLKKENFIVKEKKSIYPTYRANRENEKFKLFKKNHTIHNLHETGLIDYIYDKCIPDSIIIFGSASKGEDIENSDIDLFVLGTEKKLELKKYEKILKREINLFFEENFNKLSDELKNNILNGIVIKGYIRVF